MRDALGVGYSLRSTDYRLEQWSLAAREARSNHG